MNSAIERLLSLRVSDVMTRDVVTVPASQAMPVAAAMLVDSRISGAPVVNERGRCVGVISAADFARRAVWAAAEARPKGADEGCPLSSDETDGDRRRPATDLVASYMSPAVHSMNVGRPIMEAARQMCQHHVHRLVVLDDDGRPAGVLTSLDLVAALIAAIEE
ncbi:MAG TPA: CBS domain-containing protein [Pirellulales bacterium]|nr:CBS domain-containing protein [Pirellulales bacterium]